MVSIIILLIVISSGSVLACSLSDRKYGDIVPISCSSLILIELIVGFFINLKVGIYVTLFVATCCYSLALIILIKKKNLRAFLKRIITPGMIFFAFASVLFFYINYCKYFSFWDEFSHWGDVVRAMVYLDDFGTNPNSMCIFPTYPPAMSIFQYFVERIDQILSPGKFNESLCYNAYQILMISFFLPLVEKVGERFKVSAFLSGIMYLLLPIMIVLYTYSSIYIDPFLGMLAGVGFAYIIVIREENLYKAILIGALVSVLTLSKASGILFTVMICVAYGVKILAEKNVKRILYPLIPLLEIVIPRLIWKTEVRIHHWSEPFGAPVDKKELFNIIIGKVDESNYRAYVWNHFFARFALTNIKWTFFGFDIPYLPVAILLILAILMLSLISVKSGNISKRTIIITNVFILSSFALFAVGTAVSYMYKFSEYEAVRLASFERYLNTVFLMLVVYIVSIFTCVVVKDGKRSGLVYALALVISIFMVPRYEIATELTRFAAERSLYDVYDLRELTDIVNTMADGDDGIWVIAQKNNGYYNLVAKSLVRPNRIGRNCSIGEPFYEGDDHTLCISCDEWQKELIEEYDWVVLCRLNYYFKKHYASIFENPEDIDEGRIFRVNKESGFLERVY